MQEKWGTLTQGFSSFSGLLFPFAFFAAFFPDLSGQSFFLAQLDKPISPEQNLHRRIKSEKPPVASGPGVP
jgi:hypothetical protein